MEIDTIQRFSPLKIPEIVKAHWKAKVPLNFVAEPSTVKSEGVFAIAKQLAVDEQREFFEWNKKDLQTKKMALNSADKLFVFADLRASETDIGELRLQNMTNGESYITFKYNLLFEVLSNPNAKGVLFFDEMNLAPNMIKAQFYKIINDNAVGDIPLSKGVLCISAGNEAEHSRGVTEDPVPLVLRRANYFLRPLTSEEYTEFAASQDYSKYILGYLGFQPSDVHKIEYDLPEGVGQPCPRTWTLLNKLIKNNKFSVGDLSIWATGLVGQAVSKKFLSFVKSAQDVDINSVLNNPEKIRAFEQDESNLSLLYAVLSGLVDMVKEKPKERLNKALRIANVIERVEFGAFFVRSVRASLKGSAFERYATDEKVVKVDVLNEFVDKYAKFVNPSR